MGLWGDASASARDRDGRWAFLNSLRCCVGHGDG